MNPYERRLLVLLGTAVNVLLRYVFLKNQTLSADLIDEIESLTISVEIAQKSTP